jgi:large subunit ribosomal protein L7e
MSAAAEKVVPESVLKKQKREAQWALEKKEVLEKQRNEAREKKKLIVHKARQYAEEYQSQV